MSKLLKMKMDELAVELLDKRKQQNLFDFVEFLKDNKFTLKRMSSYTWKIHHKNICIGSIRLNSLGYQPDGSWTVAPGNPGNPDKPSIIYIYIENLTNIELQNLILNSVTPIPHPGCGRIRKKEHFFGKTVEQICTCVPFLIVSPDGAVLENVKELIITTKNIMIDVL